MSADQNKKQQNGIANDLSLQCIARIHTDFPEKFGVPRQSGIVESLRATIVFEPKYRNPDALRGLEGFSHIWLIWGFHHNKHNEWAPMVKPPRLGGNTRMGVFATRSPYRPNPLGLSSVRLEGIEVHELYGPIIHVSGVDLVDQTPIYDIKPYLAYTDSHPDSSGGFLDRIDDYRLQVDFPEDLRRQLPEKYHEAVMAILSQDPRPSYHDDPERIYGFYFAGYNIRFKVKDKNLSVYEITKL
jgi:tRNA-Thr(GGU) m(6)t(6)A37 methyltransferase TsaA